MDDGTVASREIEPLEILPYKVKSSKLITDRADPSGPVPIMQVTPCASCGQALAIYKIVDVSTKYFNIIRQKPILDTSICGDRYDYN